MPEQRTRGSARRATGPKRAGGQVPAQTEAPAAPLSALPARAEGVAHVLDAQDHMAVGRDQPGA